MLKRAESLDMVNCFYKQVGDNGGLRREAINHPHPKSRSVKRGPGAIVFFTQRCMFSFSTSLQGIIITKMSTKLIKDAAREHSNSPPPLPQNTR